MKAAGILRIFLFLSLLAFWAVSHDSDTAPLLAQNAPQDERSLRKPAQSTPNDQEDQEVIKGKASISVAVDLVSLQVLVTDDKGNVLTGLRPENFTVYEDNIKQDISNFSPIESNITAVMLVEYSNNVGNFITDVWDAMYGFANSLRKGDWVAVIGYDMQPMILCDFTQNRNDLESALRRFTYPATSYSNLSDALIDALDRTQEIQGKVAIVLISTGLDTLSRHTYQDALDKCKEANASIYAISLGQHYRLMLEAFGRMSNELSLNLAMADNRLRSFADFSGGAAYFPRFQSELPAIFRNISQLLRSQYSIAYASTNTAKDGKFRRIKVEVNTPLTDSKGKPLKLKVITRKGYKAST